MCGVARVDWFGQVQWEGNEQRAIHGNCVAIPGGRRTGPAPHVRGSRHGMHTYSMLCTRTIPFTVHTDIDGPTHPTTDQDAAHTHTHTRVHTYTIATCSAGQVTGALVKRERERERERDPGGKRASGTHLVDHYNKLRFEPRSDRLKRGGLSRRH
jgi:hypothetical protein